MIQIYIKCLNLTSGDVCINVIGNLALAKNKASNKFDFEMHIYARSGSRYSSANLIFFMEKPFYSSISYGNSFFILYSSVEIITTCLFFFLQRNNANEYTAMVVLFLNHSQVKTIIFGRIINILYKLLIFSRLHFFLHFYIVFQLNPIFCDDIT